MSERDRRRRERGRRTADGKLMARRVPDAAWSALRRRVIARDTHCCICGEVVDKSLRFPDPMSATVDHVIPVVDGGQHTLENCKLAHYSCNSPLHSYKHQHSPPKPSTPIPTSGGVGNNQPPPPVN